MAKIKGATPEEYLGNVPVEHRPRARELHRALCEALPHASVQIKWGQPAFVDDTILVAYAVFSKHINLYTTPSSRDALAGELGGYTLGKGSIQLPHDEPLPLELIRLVATARATEFREHHVRWM
ncbi:iron chaperone [Paeniglutamicibacter sp.]|uniref:iron chaperone n=1 Tax=Paeniglutamicibacter sp. TaxID=1934391 RepID=UPI003989CF20